LLYKRLSSCTICIAAPVSVSLIQVSRNLRLTAVALYLVMCCHTHCRLSCVTRQFTRNLFNNLSI